MPGVKRGRDNDESDNEEAEGEQESESDRSSEDESTSSDGTESEESSELDEEECEHRRGEYLTDLNELERQFTVLREQLYRERVTQVESKLAQVRIGEAVEYVSPMDELKQAHQTRLDVNCIMRELRIKNILNKHEADALAAKQNYENEQIMVLDSLESELLERIRGLEEDRNNVDVTSQVWAEQHLNRGTRGSQAQGTNNNMESRRRKPTTVVGPYIVYMLPEEDILEDWTAIRKALTASKRKNKFGKISSPRHLSDSFTL